MHSHHSHSGDYISHAEGQLEEMVLTAKKNGFTHFCLTEHMPRLDDMYLYPEEIDKKYTKLDLGENFERYLAHARKIQARENALGDIKILVGYEVEGIDDAHIEAANLISERTDMCVGSVHYVNHIPIDFNADLWLKARESVGGTSRELYKEYFELQYRVLKTLKPAVVGHFDLIRLFDVKDHDPTTGKDFHARTIQQDWPDVWSLIVRNVNFVVEYGGLFEINGAAIRKGWETPYPQTDIAQEIIRQGGKFSLSDDSHTYAQIGLNYHKVWDYIVNTLHLETIYHLDFDPTGAVTVVEDKTSELSLLSFWAQYK
ncbi:hypothetical protein PUMCH_000418 [Australozyma saopauloensis]|uniref:Histidinol-phosphatase n=1 Tax=Australozyma saopauloensis TaxID=291208 RepID=A0AAX4H5S2_9ASCO|nr:hypothetical protein PUMCH_000418 [[Candida] saopauloensis]